MSEADATATINAVEQQKSGVTLQYDPYSPYQYPWMAINALFVLWAFSTCLYKFHQRTSRKFGTLQEDKKRNVITYVCQFLVTGLALGMQLYGGWDILRHDTVSSHRQLELCTLALWLVTLLYLWEMAYRSTMGVPLLLHHVVTIALIQMGYSAFFDTRRLLYLRFGLLLTLHATTEQLSFVGLYAYRLDLFHPRTRSLVVYTAALQAFIVKTIVTIAAVLLFIRTMQDRSDGDDDDDDGWISFWSIIFLPLLLTLYAAQVVASRILYSLAVKCARRDDDDQLPKSAKTATVSYPDMELAEDDTNSGNMIDSNLTGDVEAPVNDDIKEDVDIEVPSVDLESSDDKGNELRELSEE